MTCATQAAARKLSQCYALSVIDPIRTIEKLNSHNFSTYEV